MHSKPNIQKTVPVKKNGYILELQIPFPDNQINSNSSNQSFSTGQIYNQSPQALSNQLQTFNQPQNQAPETNLSFNQNNSQISVHLPQASSENNKAFSFRNFFNR